MPKMCTPSFVRILALLVIASAALPASSQVVIRESVDLNEPSSTPEAPESFGGGGHTVTFIAQRDGSLNLFYGIIQRAGSQYPAGQPTLEVYNEGVLVATDDVLSHTWPAPVPIQRNCGGLYDEYNYNTTDSFDLQIPVLTGETISFLFKSDQGTYGDDPNEGGAVASGDQWAVAIGSFAPSCPWPVELFQFIAEVIPEVSVDFIRSTDNSKISDPNASLRVTTYQTDIDLPASSGYGDTGPDAETYRLEARNIPTGETVTFEVKTTEAGGGPTNTYTYGAEEGVDGADVVYRSAQFFRFVSNGIPTVGADPAGDYDDEYSGPGAMEDPTLLVKLDARVRGAVSDPSGERASVELPVGLSETPDMHDTILTGGLIFNILRESIKKPTIFVSLSTDRANEDWAQGRIQFENEGLNSPVLPVKNILRVSGVATTSGTVTVDGFSGCCFVPVIFSVSVDVDVDDTPAIIAANIATAITNEPDFTASSHIHFTDGTVADYFVRMDVSLTGWPDNVDITGVTVSASGVVVTEQDLRFEPQLFTWDPVIPDNAEEHSVSLNYADGDLTTIDVFAVLSQTYGTQARAIAWPFLFGPFLDGIENTIFIREQALSRNDALDPLTFGHELGHILFDGPFPGHVENHSIDDTNLMFSPTSDEEWSGTKRLNFLQIDDARTTSGPSAPANPKILEQN